MYRRMKVCAIAVLAIAASSALADAVLNYERSRSFNSGEQAFKLASAGQASSKYQSSGAFAGTSGVALQLGYFLNSAAVLKPGDVMTARANGVLTRSGYVAESLAKTSVISLELTNGSVTACFPTMADIEFTVSGSGTRYLEKRYDYGTTSSDCDALSTAAVDTITDSYQTYTWDADTSQDSVHCVRQINSSSAGSATAKSRWMRVSLTTDGFNVSCSGPTLD